MTQTLSNDILSVTIDSLGAELQSIVNKRTGHQYLWQGDKRFWGRRSPVLFPIVGAVWNGTYRVDGKEYAMGQHGFARDMEFSVMETVADDEAWFALESNSATLEKYPFRFRLEIGYGLHEARLRVMLRVVNLDDRTIHFQIGAHPAFNYPGFSASDPVHGFFDIDSDRLQAEIIAEKGCVGIETQTVDKNADGLVEINAGTFARDALIFGNGNVKRVSMLDMQRMPYLTLLFSSPAVGLWSPSADAPFVCIEPWWGRCDHVGYNGDFAHREYINTLEPGKTFNAGYMVIIDNI